MTSTTTGEPAHQAMTTLSPERLAEIEEISGHTATARYYAAGKEDLRNAIRDLLADRECLAHDIASHEQFLEVLDSAHLMMNGRGIRESLQLIRRIASGEREGSRGCGDDGHE